MGETKSRSALLTALRGTLGKLLPQERQNITAVFMGGRTDTRQLGGSCIRAEPLAFPLTYIAHEGSAIRAPGLSTAKRKASSTGSSRAKARPKHLKKLCLDACRIGAIQFPDLWLSLRQACWTKRILFQSRAVRRPGRVVQSAKANKRDCSPPR